MDLAHYLAIQATEIASFGSDDIARFSAAFREVAAKRGVDLIRQGEANDREYLLLSGRAVSFVRDADGRETCVGLYMAPCAIAPHFVRSLNGVSLVSLETLDDAYLAQATAADLMALMAHSAAIAEWGNAIAQDELKRRAAREWCLSVLPSVQRLDWFRQNYAGYEGLFPHRHIASFLGVTPVTLSRARNTPTRRR